MSEPIFADAKLCIDLLEDKDGGGQHSEGLPQEHLQQPRGHQSCRSGFSFFDPGSGNSFGSDPDPVVPLSRTRIRQFQKVDARIRLFRWIGPGSGCSDGSDPNSVVPMGRIRIRLIRRAGSGSGISKVRTWIRLFRCAGSESFETNNI